MKTFTHITEFEDVDGWISELEIEYSIDWGQDARTNCLPEDAEPSTHDYVEIIGIKSRYGEKWIATDLQDNWDHAESITDELIAAAMEALEE